MRSLFTLRLCYPILFTALLMGCSSRHDLTPLSKSSAPPKTQALFLIGINWSDTYDDKELGKRVVVHSGDIAPLKEKENTHSGAQFYHMMRQMYLFNGNGDRFRIKIENKRGVMREGYGLYAITPGTYRLDRFLQDEQRLQEGVGEASTERHKVFGEQYDLPPREWSFEPGKVYYLGDLQLDFETEKVMFGWVPREQLNRSVSLQQIAWADNFALAKKWLETKIPKLPTASIINLSKPEVQDLRPKAPTKDAEEDAKPKSNEPTFF